MDLNIRFFYKTVFNSQNEMYYSGSNIYKNGAVKRVMFDGGYATLSEAGVPDGTTSCATMRGVRVVADAWGRAEQINHYYPYGLIHKPS